MIYYSSISKTYNPGLFKKKVQAVHELTLEIQAGEVFGLIGPNGAGKSTAIRLLLGLIRPDSGQIMFRGKPLQNSEMQKQIGYLPENPYLYDHLTLIELLRFCGRTSGLTAEIIERRCQELMEMLGLSAAQKRPLRTFSKGMLQRAGICFALLHDPPVVILDEPMSGLDPIGRKMVFDLVMELKKRKKTVFFCSHILNDVERLCDRIGLLVQGRLIGVYGQQDFAQSTEEPALHLVIDSLTVDQQEKLQPLITDLRLMAGQKQIVSLHPSELTAVSRALDSFNVKTYGSRSESVSLEQFFMKIVEEKTQ